MICLDSSKFPQNSICISNTFDQNFSKLRNEKYGKADNKHLCQLFSIPKSGYEAYVYQHKNYTGNESAKHS